MQLHWCEGDTSMLLHLAAYQHMLKQQPSASFCSGVSSGKKSKILSFLTQRFRGKAKIPHSPSCCCIVQQRGRHLREAAGACLSGQEYRVWQTLSQDRGAVVLQMPLSAQDVILPLGLWSDALEHLQSLGEPVSLQFYHINMEKCQMSSHHPKGNI